MNPLQIIKEHIQEHHPNTIIHIRPGGSTGIIRSITTDLNDPHLTKYIWITTPNKDTTITISANRPNHTTSIDLKEPNSLTEISKIINKWMLTSRTHENGDTFTNEST